MGTAWQDRHSTPPIDIPDSNAMIFSLHINLLFRFVRWPVFCLSARVERGCILYTSELSMTKRKWMQISNKFYRQCAHLPSLTVMGMSSRARVSNQFDPFSIIFCSFDFYFCSSPWLWCSLTLAVNGWTMKCDCAQVFQSFDGVFTLVHFIFFRSLPCFSLNSLNCVRSLNRLPWRRKSNFQFVFMEFLGSARKTERVESVFNAWRMNEIVRVSFGQTGFDFWFSKILFQCVVNALDSKLKD